MIIDLPVGIFLFSSCSLHNTYYVRYCKFSTFSKRICTHPFDNTHGTFPHHQHGDCYQQHRHLSTLPSSYYNIDVRTDFCGILYFNKFNVVNINPLHALLSVLFFSVKALPRPIISIIVYISP